jgi:enoyl-CoA hydratase
MAEPASTAVLDGVVVITMDDGKANAMSPAMQRAINEGLDTAERGALPVVLQGRPGIFSAGFDLKTLAAGGQPAVDMLRGGLELSLRLLEFPTPVIAASTGHAIAMGIFVLTSCDHRIGAHGSFRYSANEVAIGMTMPWSTIEILRQRLTPAAVSRAVVFAETFTPDNAVQHGVLDETIEPDRLAERAMEFARQVGALDARAHADSKKRLRHGSLDAIRAGLERDIVGWHKQFLA